ncbi:LysR substrate-binding domain-containing protein [Amantichitinum ursilacus]|uniref:Glycine cleavage system transcriptional activator n=1 Tax=Amantichitinum ursilacus TaxID=857265 RepID=A0A0N1JSL2_9NEIS|nr:LysR substrate-binding domain-containing protein [Amantichitinum ursilacus]KPC52638.1 Glycine cleavage system transcriptional activator [Amantichitinum ursilacus]
MRNLPPLPALRAFEAVSRLGSMVQAAEELHVTHSAISHQIKALEEELAVLLFTRQGKRLLLTEEGRIYAMQVRAAMRDLQTATEMVLNRPRGDELVLSVIPSFATHWLIPRLPRFNAQFPHYKMRLRAGLALDDLKTGMVDLAIRIGARQWPDVQTQLLMPERAIGVAAPHFNGGVLPQTIEEFVSCPVIRSYDSGRDWCRAAGLDQSLPPGLNCNDSNLLVQAVLLGQGVAVTRRSLADGLIREGRLVQLLGVEVPFDRDYWLAWPQRSEGSAKLDDFMGWLLREAADYQAGLPPLAG